MSEKYINKLHGLILKLTDKTLTLHEHESIFQSLVRSAKFYRYSHKRTTMRGVYFNQAKKAMQDYIDLFETTYQECSDTDFKIYLEYVDETNSMKKRSDEKHEIKKEIIKYFSE